MNDSNKPTKPYLHPNGRPIELYEYWCMCGANRLSEIMAYGVLGDIKDDVGDR